MLSPYIEYAARCSGKTQRLGNNALSFLLKDLANKVFIFCRDESSRVLIEKHIYLNENLYHELKYKVHFITNWDMKNSSKFFEQNIIIGTAINDQRVKFYFDDFEDLSYCYSTILHEFLENNQIYDRLYLTTTPRSDIHLSRQSGYQQDELNNLRTFLKYNNELNILKIGYFGGENTL